VLEIPYIIAHLTTSPSLADQTATIIRYFTPDAGFRHPLCAVDPGIGSRTKVIGVYRWARIMGIYTDVSVSSVVLSETTLAAYCDITLYYHVRFSPFAPRPSHLMAILHLRKQEDGFYYICAQEDFYQLDDAVGLGIPPLAPVVHFFLSLVSYFCMFGALIVGSLHVLWKFATGQIKRGDELYMVEK